MTLDLYERALAGSERAERASGRRTGDAVAGRSRGTLRGMRLRSGLLALLALRARSRRRRDGGLAPGHARAARRRGRLRLAAGARSACTRGARPRRRPRRRAEPRRDVALRRPAARPRAVTAFSVDPRNGLLQQLNLGAGCLASVASGRLRRRARARGRLGDRGLARRPARLRRRRPRAGAVASFARQPNGSLVQLNGHRRLHRDDADARLRQRAAAGGRRRDRDLARRPLRLRRRGIRATRITVFSRDAATGRLTAARGHRGLPARQPLQLHARHGHRLALGDRHLARTGRRSTSPRPPAR